ncbi:hypothetical protein TNCV_2197561 [Trichonephila clavipes]|nr:hypothetical protein TNCV_2197561 [Trichonephila clavipes]
MRRPACPKHARLDSGQESTLAIPYAVLFQLQGCSPPDELYAVGHYHPGKQRNLNGSGVRDDMVESISSAYLRPVKLPFRIDAGPYVRLC